jgi:hypothetical protein
MKKLVVLLLAVVLALAACQTEKPDAIVRELEEATNDGDLEKAAAQFGENAFVNIIPPRQCSPGIFRGRDGIRGWLSAAMALNARLGVEVLEVNGETVSARTEYADDDTRDLGITPLVVREEYIIKGGKISSLTSALTDESLAELQAAMSFPHEITSDCLVGIWAGHGILQFKDDGTFAWAESIGLLEKMPSDFGEYELIGTTLSFHSSENSKICPGLHGSYELSLTEESRLQFNLLEAECRRRKDGLDEYGRIE